jgi:hypothetical protein
MSRKELRRHLKTSINENKLLTKAQRARLLTTVMENINVFSDEDNPMGHIVGHDVSFNRTSDKRIFVPPRPMNPKCAAETIRQVEELVKAGVMGETNSPNNFPLVLVAKSPGAPPRICCDLRAFNLAYSGSWFQVPTIRDCIAKISQCSVYSALDCTASFHQIGLRDDDGVVPSTHQIAVSLPNGKRYSYRTLPFGTKDSSFIFSRVLNEVMIDFQADSSIYIDDMTLHTNDYNSQIALLERVLPHLIKAGVNSKLNPKKTTFCTNTVDVLGHTITHHSVHIQKEKLAAIRDLQPPRDRAELQSLIGVLSWSRRFVPEFASVAEPMTRLLKKGQPTLWPECWGEEQETAFRSLQSSMLESSSLATPDFTKPFEVWTDASAIGMGAVLVQENADGTKCAVEFFSKQLTLAERKYAVCEREALAILRALQKFKPYLLMANSFEILVKSDHRGLTSLYKHADESTRLWRWAQQMNEFTYVVKWMSGKSEDAAIADGLSRARTLLQGTIDWMESHRVPIPPTPAGSTESVQLLQQADQQADQTHHTREQLETWVRSTPLPTERSATLAQAARVQPHRQAAANAAAAAQPTTCTRTAHCTKPDRHVGRCPGSPDADDDSSTNDEEEFVYDKIVCRAVRAGGIHGFRMRWIGFGPEDDSYESLWTMKRQVRKHHVDTLIADFVRRERQGDIRVDLLPGDGYPRWTNAISPTAPTPNHVQEGGTIVPPFPEAVSHSDDGFLAFDGINAEDLRKHQQLEPDTHDILAYMHDNEYRPSHLAANQRHAWSQYASSISVDAATGLLMRQYTGSTGPHKMQQHHVVLLPQALLQHAFDWAHALCGHHGIHATMCTIRTRFHCYRLEPQLRAYIAACEICNRADRDNRQSPYGSIPVHTFNQAIGFDFLGPLTAQGSNGEQYLAIMVDHATKYVIIHPTVSCTAADAVDALTHYILTSGTIPEEIFTDRGSFTGQDEVFTALLLRFGIRNRRAMSLNPRGDSHAESQVKNIVRILRKIVQDYPDEWPQAAPWATYCYNAKYNTTTGTSPFYAKHAVEPKQPVDFLLPRVGGLEAPRSIAELSDRIGEINEAVEQGVARLHSSYVQRNANLRGARDFRAGDQVWKHRVYPESFEAAGIDTKFHLPFEPEPYLVLERRSERHSRIRLAHNDAAPYEDVHHLRLKLCAPRDDAIQFHQAVPLPSSAHESDSDNDDND